MEYEQETYRRSIRLKHYDYSQPGAYFITICTYNKKCLFGEVIEGEMILNEKGEIVKQYWLEIPLHYSNVSLDEFVIMPNHMHGIVIITELNNTLSTLGAIHESPLQQIRQQRRSMLLSKVIGRFKMNSAKQINILRRTPGVPVWQRNYYEHIIRSENELNETRTYMTNNPMEWGLDSENPMRNMVERGEYNESSCL